ncbi:PLDc N-terminal domain-containing protein [Erythrobacter sp. SCSIO 43205]|uniref:PLDc N-terminal domain-containing protein n=1 Tax=Erythrobacter sp. SCSIO 43205 TaxID=2779361 RepID=UPI001CAA1F0C|nr:PLDc N-terminal domain-containing protein [Erythrobacter sp. SCSIO 43205]UAB78398.1 PLDc N-terminal domain-containing protein [Erythrobacter sp. SCSIO 43205]
MEYGIIGLLVLALNIWALFSIWTSGSSVAAKIVWTILIFALPVIGVIAWLIFGPRGTMQTA